MAASAVSLSGVAKLTRGLGVGAIGLDGVLVARALTGADSPLRFAGGGTPAWAAGIFAGALQMIHMTLENFGARTGENALVTLAFMLAALLTWGVAARRAQ